MIRTLLHTAFLIIFINMLTWAQQVRYPVKNYTTREYGKDYHPANMAIARDQQGIIYAANGQFILEYDAQNWNTYSINQPVWILSIAVDPSGIIYAGSQNDFGFFSPDTSGRLSYFSLSGLLKEEDKNFSNVWRTHLTSKGVVFQTEEKIFIYADDRMKVLTPETSFHTSFVVNDILYVRQRDKGLMFLKGDRFELIPGGEMFDTAGVFAMLPFGGKKNKILIATRDNGCRIYDHSKPDNALSHFIIKDSTDLYKAKIYGGILLHDNNFAFNTLYGGIFIVDTAGVIISAINKNSGLNVNDVKQVIQDGYNNLWLALNNGISRVDYSSPLSFYREGSGITGDIHAVLRFNGLLYAGTSDGLFVQIKDAGFNAKKLFLPLQNFSRQIWSLSVVENSLLAGTSEGLFEITDNNFRKISDNNTYSMHYSQQLNLLFTGGNQGLAVFRKDLLWKPVKAFEDIRVDIIGISEHPDTGTDTTEIWLGTRYQGTVRLKIDKHLNVRSDMYDTFDGLPDGPVFPFELTSRVIFGTPNGLFCFIDEEEVKKNLPDSLKDDESLYIGEFNTTTLLNNTITCPVSVLTEANDKIWLCLDNNICYTDQDKNNTIITRPFLGVDLGNINVIYPEDNGMCWIGTTEGLIGFDVNKHKNYDQQYPAIIRKITSIQNDSVLFYGAFQQVSYKPVLSYKNNSLKFDFTAAFYEYKNKILFSFKLIGHDTAWTKWENKAFKEYTNLYEGDYTFVVKAKNIFDTESSEAVCEFTILPPWYRKFWAYIIYVISGAFLIWVAVKIYTYRLKQENIRLENIVRERTAEVVRQKEAIEDSIRYAQRIQTAVIPSEEDVSRMMPESFVLFKPRDIVSGDFYWISHIDKKIIVIAADCTGHGVPGAFMSMLGVAFLNEIVNKDRITAPDKILNNLRKMVVDALQQQGISGEAKDGMDMVILSIGEDMTKMQYAGAYNPLYIVKKTDPNDDNGDASPDTGGRAIISKGGYTLSEIRADKMPVAIYDKMQPFVKHDITLQKGDTFYFFSDGYVDQFGGPKGKKFKSGKFKELLLDIQNQSMEEQKQILKKTLEEWQACLDPGGDTYDQVDDIVVVGIRI